MKRLLFWLPWLLVPLAGAVFAYRLTQVPSRLETAVFFIIFFVAPTLRYPRFGIYYLMSVSLFIPLFRRLYYLVAERPDLDYLMLVGDGVMGGFIAALAMMGVLRKERIRDRLTLWVLIYEILLFVKVFFLNDGSTVEGLYGYKFNGLYVLFYFAGSYVLGSRAEIVKVLRFSTWMLVATGLYGLKQFLLGFSAFEQKWLDSITFTTLRIEGVVRIFSTYVSPAAMADGMCILMLLGALAMAGKSASEKLKGVFFTAVSIGPLLLATVRTSWAAAGAGLLFFWVFLRLRQGWIRWVLFTLMLGGAITYMTTSDSTADSQNAAFSQNLRGGKKSASEVLISSRTQALANPLQEYSIRKRMEIWGEIWYRTLHRPLGHGQGTTGYAHSYYFQVLGEIGFPGMLAFLIILFLGFKRGFHILGKTKDPGTAETARYCMSILFVFSILNLTGTHLHSNPGDIFFWFALGVLANLNRQAVEENENPPLAPAPPLSPHHGAAGKTHG